MNFTRLNLLHILFIFTALLPSYAAPLPEEDSTYVEHELAERLYAQQRQLINSQTDQFRQPSAVGSTNSPDSKTLFDDPRFSATLAYQAFTQYNSYGLVIQPQGISSQPFFNLRYRVFENTDNRSFLNSTTLFLTTWSDFSSNQNLSNPVSSYRNFTETDLIVGFTAIMAQRVSATFNLVTYVSPAGAYGFGAWTRGTFVYDDSGQLSPTVSIKPQLSVVYTFPAASAISLVPSAFLFEPGITPSISFWSKTSHPATLSFPIRVGLGNKFYDGSTYGFTSFGPQFSIRVPMLSGKGFNTNLSLGYLYYNLGPTAAEFSSNNSTRQNVFNLGLYLNF
jgi:hypothetical protein